MKKRVLAIITSICMIIAMTPMGMAFAEGNPTGRLGDDVFWELEDGGILHVTGTGDMYDYSSGGSNRDLESIKSDITEIHMESGITRIGNYAFCNLDNLKSITWFEPLDSIGKGAFEADSTLEEIDIPDSVTKIEANAFKNCQKAKKLSIGKSLDSIGSDAFYYMSYLETIGVDEENENFSVLDNILYDKDMTKVLFCPMTYSKKVTIPDTVEVLGKQAFQFCNYIPEIEFNEGLKSLEYECLGYCYSLTSITLPQSLEKIDRRAFYFDYVNNITIPANVNSIGYMAFGGINDLTLTFEGSVPEFVPNDKDEYRIASDNSAVDIVYGCTVEGWTDDVFETFENTIRLHAHHNLTEESVAPTCTETGIAPSYVCSDCGNRYANKDATEPIEDYEAWKKDEANIIPANGHSYGAWHMAKCPTCIKEGKICRICDVCLDVEYKSAAILPHEIVKVEASEPTCTKEGVIEHWTCSECGTHFADAEGKVCLEDESWVIPKKAHNVEIIPKKAATCTEDGLTEGRTCKDCGLVIVEQKVILATGHSFDSSSVTTKATFGKNGVRTFKCSDCSAIKIH